MGVGPDRINDVRINGPGRRQNLRCVYCHAPSTTNLYSDWLYNDREMRGIADSGHHRDGGWERGVTIGLWGPLGPLGTAGDRRGPAASLGTAALPLPGRPSALSSRHAAFAAVTTAA